MQDTVILDGLEPIQDWPVVLAESLLSDNATWGTYTRDSYAAGFLSKVKREALPERERFKDFYKLATSVNGYNRHDVEWASTQLDAIKAQEAVNSYTTQELLDLVFFVCRGERFSDGLISNSEPQLRAMIQEVVNRVHSDAPPTFIVSEKNKKDGL